MSLLATGFSRALAARAAAAELAEQVEMQLEAGAQVGGALVLATAAAGRQGFEVGACLAERWPEASLVGTSFEGIVAEGRAWREEPALALIAWPAGEGEPVPMLVDSAAFAGDSAGIEHLEHMLEEAAGDGEAEDLLLVFPDAVAATDVEAVLARVAPPADGPSVAGAAASGVDGAPCLAWADGDEEPGASIALYLRGYASGGARLAQAVGSRFASPWLEVSSCRGRWVDQLEDESATDWARRQLGLEASDAIEANLDRLLLRVRDVPGWTDPEDRIDAVTTSEAELDYVERYLVGVAPGRGAIALAAPVSNGARVAFALPDPDRAREALRQGVAELGAAPLVLQLTCRARDASLHGDPDVESAVVATAAEGRVALGTIAPFQLGPDSLGRPRIHVHRTMLIGVGAR